MIAIGMIMHGFGGHNFPHYEALGIQMVVLQIIFIHHKYTQRNVVCLSVTLCIVAK